MALTAKDLVPGGIYRVDSGSGWFHVGSIVRAIGFMPNGDYYNVWCDEPPTSLARKAPSMLIWWN
jgi:hypothetical protein